jgi:hypothetical protein
MGADRDEVSVSLRDVYARSEHMVGRKIADEFVLVPIVGRGADIDGIYDLTRVGAFIWERLDGKASGERIVAAMLESFAVERAQAEADYLEFLSKLLSIKAVKPVVGL